MDDEIQPWERKCPSCGAELPDNVAVDHEGVLFLFGDLPLTGGSLENTLRSADEHEFLVLELS